MDLRKEFEFNKQDTSLHHRNVKKGIDLLSDIDHLFNEVVRLILDASKGFGQQKTGQLFNNLTLSGEVDLTIRSSNLIKEDLTTIINANECSPFPLY